MDDYVETKLYIYRREELIRWAEQEQLVQQCLTQNDIEHWLSTLRKGWPFNPVESSVIDGVNRHNSIKSKLS